MQRPAMRAHSTADDAASGRDGEMMARRIGTCTPLTFTSGVVLTHRGGLCVHGRLSGRWRQAQLA
jgi:hypothetical protein